MLRPRSFSASSSALVPFSEFGCCGKGPRLMVQGLLSRLISPDRGNVGHASAAGQPLAPKPASRSKAPPGVRTSPTLSTTRRRAGAEPCRAPVFGEDVVLPCRTTCFGPRTACAGLTAKDWPIVSQSKTCGSQVLLASQLPGCCSLLRPGRWGRQRRPVPLCRQQ